MTIKECISAPLHHAGYSLQVVVDGVVLLPLLCLTIPNTHHVRISFSTLAITSLLPQKTPVRSQSLKEHKYPRLADGLESKRNFFPGNMHACGASQGHRDMRAAHEKENNNNKKRASKRKDRETEPGVPCTC
jgi:hypothetical protein